MRFACYGLGHCENSALRSSSNYELTEHNGAIGKRIATGRGGMGIVYEAEQLSVGRHVALKVLPFAAVLDPKQLQRFKNEAQAAVALDHPNIVHVHCVGCQRGVHYYAMQLIEGQTLADVIAELRAGQQLPSEGQRAIAKATAATRTRQ